MADYIGENELDLIILHMNRNQENIMDNIMTNIDGDLSDGSCAKTCVDCGTSKRLPGETLCNACGISSRKKCNSRSEERKRGEICWLLVLKYRGKRSRSAMATMEKPSRMKLGEVEQATILLMALSCGSVYF
ncbi:GATA transcription factor 16-like [Impatiens glandulifera]|uniref:GATA transcription factor 16-like n=1 Tax=Impatiens glandulifera TaxID=253017 RepID=UPI001FB07615|nr:GATA transcription factor 16-like [Impatiens glandulifera]